MSLEADDRLGRHYAPSSEYVDRWDDSPKISIPPPELQTVNGAPQLQVHYPDRVDWLSDRFGSPEFVQYLRPKGGLTFAHNTLDWKYEDRRQCQSVLPFLYIGPHSATKNTQLLQQAAFTLLVAIRPTAQARMMDASRAAADLSIEYLNVDLRSPEDLIHEFPKAIKAVNDHLATMTSRLAVRPEGAVGGRVLVFCDTGHVRSAAFIASYLMAIYGIDLVKAIQIVQSQRFSVGLDDATKAAMGTFEMLLEANRAVEASESQTLKVPTNRSDGGYQTQMPGRSSRKRSLADVNEFEMDQTSAGEESGEQWRGGQAPFEDVGQ